MIEQKNKAIWNVGPQLLTILWQSQLVLFLWWSSDVSNTYIVMIIMIHEIMFSEGHMLDQIPETRCTTGL